MNRLIQWVTEGELRSFDIQYTKNHTLHVNAYKTGRHLYKVIYLHDTKNVDLAIDIVAKQMIDQYSRDDAFVKENYGC